MNTIEFRNIVTDGEARVNEVTINNKSFNTPNIYACCDKRFY